MAFILSCQNCYKLFCQLCGSKGWLPRGEGLLLFAGLFLAWNLVCCEFAVRCSLALRNRFLELDYMLALRQGSCNCSWMDNSLEMMFMVCWPQRLSINWYGVSIYLCLCVLGTWMNWRGIADECELDVLWARARIDFPKFKLEDGPQSGDVVKEKEGYRIVVHKESFFWTPLWIWILIKVEFLPSRPPMRWFAYIRLHTISRCCSL